MAQKNPGAALAATEPMSAPLAQTPSPEVEAEARTDTIYHGRTVRKGERVRMPRAEYISRRSVFVSEEDAEAHHRQAALPAAQRQAEHEEFMARVHRMDEQDRQQRVVSARIAEEQADRTRQMAAEGRAAAERSAR
jgi:hypothetical protein